MMRLILVLAICLLPPMARGGPASERVFSTEALRLLSAGDIVVYSHVRGGSAGEALRPVADGEIRIALGGADDGSREVAVTMGEVGKLRPVSIFPASSGNPIVPIFLESALRAMARATGGSEFYIRNRIKDALGSGGTMTPVSVDIGGRTLEAVEVTFEPFKLDKARDRMGAFADMTLTFVVSDKVPGDIVRFVATTGGAEGDAAYREVIAWRRQGAED